MSVNSEQLEAEADALLKQSKEPPAKPDTEIEEPPVDTGTPETAETEIPAPDESPETPPATIAADTDELEGLSLENAAERIRNAQARMTRATMEAADSRRALLDAQRTSQSLEEEVERLQAELQAAARPPASTDTATGMATLETLQDDYPQIIGPLVATLKEMRAELDGVKGTVTTRDKTDKAENARLKTEAHFTAIRNAHSDFDQIKNSDEFGGWVSRQPRVTSILLYGDGVPNSGYRNGGNAAEIIEVLDAYKKSVGIAKRTEQAREAAAPTLRKTARPQPKGLPTFTRAQIDAMTPAEFNKREAEIDAAMADGRVI